jgi:GT2 family glycosyltransferase
MTQSPAVTVIIPTYGRDHALTNTLSHLLAVAPAPEEIIVVDQSKEHTPEVVPILEAWDRSGAIRWLRLSEPSIPVAMNRGLIEASQQFVLFLDDDIIPGPDIIAAHARAIEKTGAGLVAGRVIQPWDETDDSINKSSLFNSLSPAWVSEFIGCNFSVRRDVILRLGGFDERFVRVAYNFEAEFAHRLRRAGYRIYYEPLAMIRHLKIAAGGTRAYGDHLTSFRPDHAVGAYYFILRTWSGWPSLSRFLGRPLRAIATRHHLRRPWWIPVTLFAEISGMGWAVLLALKGPQYLNSRSSA